MNSNFVPLSASELVEKIHFNAQKLKVAPWTDNNSDMGPVISKEHKDKILKTLSSLLETISLLT